MFQVSSVRVEVSDSVMSVVWFFINVRKRCRYSILSVSLSILKEISETAGANQDSIRESVAILLGFLNPSFPVILSLLTRA